MRRKDIKKTIREYFLINPTAKHRVREIERLLGLPLPSVIRYCKELESEGILTVRRIGNVVFYTANRTDGRYILEKRLHNIRSLYDSGLVEFLRTELNNPVIVVFGSFARGEDTEESDIDLYIESPSKKGINLERFGKLLRREIQVFRHRSIQEVRNPRLADSIINGIVLNGFMEVFG